MGVGVSTGTLFTAATELLRKKKNRNKIGVFFSLSPVGTSPALERPKFGRSHGPTRTRTSFERRFVPSHRRTVLCRSTADRTAELSVLPRPHRRAAPQDCTADGRIALPEPNCTADSRTAPPTAELHHRPNRSPNSIDADTERPLGRCFALGPIAVRPTAVRPTASIHDRNTTCVR